MSDKCRWCGAARTLSDGSWGEWACGTHGGGEQGYPMVRSVTCLAKSEMQLKAAIARKDRVIGALARLAGRTCPLPPGECYVRAGLEQKDRNVPSLCPYARCVIRWAEAEADKGVTE